MILAKISPKDDSGAVNLTEWISVRNMFHVKRFVNEVLGGLRVAQLDDPGEAVPRPPVDYVSRETFCEVTTLPDVRHFDLNR
jgi:hypothetical protein